MTTGGGIDPACPGPAPDQFVLVGIAEHPMLREDRDRRSLQSLPLVPARLVHGLDRALHDRGVEARDEAIIRLPNVRHPGVDDRVIAEELASGGFVLERHWPGREIPTEPSPAASLGSPFPDTWPSSITSASTRSGRAAAARNAVRAPIDCPTSVARRLGTSSSIAVTMSPGKGIA